VETNECTFVGGIKRRAFPLRTASYAVQIFVICCKQKSQRHNRMATELFLCC